MPDKFVKKIVTPFGERLIKAAAVTNDVKNALKDIVLINFSTTFAQVGEILTAGKLPILVDETIEDSPYYYNFVYDNDGLEYVFGNLSGTTYREYRVSGGGWGVLSSITFEKSSNRVTTWSSTPSNTKYPSEKLVYDTIGDVETLLAAL